MQYKLNLNLQQQAEIKIAISFWEKKEVKNEAKKFFASCENRNKFYEVREKWAELTKTAIDEWKKDLLPQKLEAELIHIVKMLGETIFNWYCHIKYVWKETKEAITCIDKLHWTAYGTVDAVKVFESYWLENPQLNITNVYSIACTYAMEDYINNLWHKLPRDFFGDSIKNMLVHIDRHILAYWKCYKENKLPNLMSIFELINQSRQNRQAREVFNLIYDLNLSIEENMLRLSTFQGYFIAIKYFWNKLTEEQRSNNVLKCARIVVKRFKDCEEQAKNYSLYKRNQYVEICIFLMNQMSNDDKKNFFNEKLGLDDSNHFKRVDVKDEILSMLLFSWPWQELFLPVLKDMIQYQDNDSRMACLFLNSITDKMVEDYRHDYSLEMSKYRHLLRAAWIIIPETIKQKLMQGEDYFTFVENLVHVWDLDSLKLILDDPNIAADRDEFIQFGSYDIYFPLVENDEFEKLDQFMDKILKLKTEEEIKAYKQSIDFFMPLFNGDRFDLADKLLDWRGSTPEERKFTKNDIDHIEIIKNLIIEWEIYDVADKFLDWQFKTEEEKRKCKDHFKSDVDSIRHICRIWEMSRGDIDEAKKKSSKFLHWFLESEEEISLFKKQMVVDFERNEQIISNLDRLKRDGMIDIFLSWCFLNNEQFQQFQHIEQVVSQLN